MLRRFLPIAVVFCFAVLGCTQKKAISAGQYRVASEDMQLDFDPQAQTASLFSTVNQLLLTSGDAGIVVWDGKLKRPRRLKLQGPIEAKAGEVKFSTAGENLVARHRVYAQGNVLRWDYHAGKPKQRAKLARSSVCRPLSWGGPTTFLHCKRGISACNQRISGRNHLLAGGSHGRSGRWGMGGR